jgi:hypothetical protein
MVTILFKPSILKIIFILIYKKSASMLYTCVTPEKKVRLYMFLHGEISGSHGGEYNDDCLLGRYVV